MSRFTNLPHHRMGNLPQTSEQQLSSGPRGNKETVGVMQKIARQRMGHPAIRRLAMNIIQDANIPSHNYLDECKAIGNYIRKHVRYLKDPNGLEQLTDPVTMIDLLRIGSAQGDCDDMALMIATLLLAVGHQPFFRIVKYKKRFGPYNHIYVVCFDNNLGKKKERIVLDGIIKHKPLGTEVPHKYGKDIKV